MDEEVLTVEALHEYVQSLAEQRKKLPRALVPTNELGQRAKCLLEFAGFEVIESPYAPEDAVCFCAPRDQFTMSMDLVEDRR